MRIDWILFSIWREKDDGEDRARERKLKKAKQLKQKVKGEEEEEDDDDEDSWKQVKSSHTTVGSSWWLLNVLTWSGH